MVAMVTALMVSGTGYAAIDFLEYFYSFTQGSYWIFDATENDGTKFQEKHVVENKETINGVGATQFAYYPKKNGQFVKESYELISYDSQYIYFHGQNRVGNLDRDDPLGWTLYNPPLKFVRFVDIGVPYTSSTTAIDPNGNQTFISQTMTFNGFEDISVPAGYFSDCLKYTAIICEDSDCETLINWNVKGVGEVRYDFYSEDGDWWEIDELNEYYISSGAIGCAIVDTNLNLIISCVDCSGYKFELTLNRYVNPSDPFGIYWELGNVNAVTCDCGGGCTTVDNNLNITMPCFEYDGIQYDIVAILEHYINPQNPFGFYWKLSH
jgi:hypothetical protein